MNKLFTIKFLQDCLVNVEQGVVNRDNIDRTEYFMETLFFHKGETRVVEYLKAHVTYYEFNFVKEDAFVSRISKDYVEIKEEK